MRLKASQLPASHDEDTDGRDDRAKQHPPGDRERKQRREDGDHREVRGEEGSGVGEIALAYPTNELGFSGVDVGCRQPLGGQDASP